MSNQKPKWKRLEDLVCQIQKSLAPEATVTQNDKVLGKKSGVMREIDISVRQNLGGYPIFVAVDVKDYKKPMNLPQLGTCIDLFEDVGANQGVVVAPMGFTDAAKKRAAEAGITLYIPIDTGEHDWKAMVRIPVVAYIYNLDSFNISLIFNRPGPLPKVMTEIDDHGLLKVELYKSDGTLLGTVENLLLNAWNNGIIPHSPGVHADMPFYEGSRYVLENEKLVPLDFRVTAQVSNHLYYHNLPVDKVSGFKPAGDQAVVITNSVTLSGISLEKIMNEWTRINSLDELSIKPIIRMHLLSMSPHPLALNLSKSATAESHSKQ